MQTFQSGDHLVTNIDNLGLTEHHGLYIGNDSVIHLAKSGIVEKTSLWQFADGNQVRVKKSALFHKQAVDSARSQLGNTYYSLINDNCEHFVNACLDEPSSSNQVSNVSHITLQGTARVGLLGATASKLATGTIANVALASTAAKMTGEYLGLPDSVNTVLGTPGDLIAKPVECLVKGTTQTLGDTFNCLSDGDITNAGIKLVSGVVETSVTTFIFTPAVVAVTGIKAGTDIAKDAWRWLWD
ncbi:lecithin retinol acyltransferase family protein [Shewanella sp. HL-SH8]|uniref:lecithin retinol acyltransferase family protein n=1 Tax=Shewanella sp. HL-SH8 TaxID=3436242 RepID=UPI003EBBD7D5